MSMVALYARVSSERQAQQATIESQLAALRKRIEGDGHLLLPQETYIDDGYSGSTLRRPALERLRDRVAEGGLDRLYVHGPDRLARRYAHQVLLLDELSAQRVEVVFLQGPAGQSAEDQLLVQVQGVIAEYERAKILERSRRGKLHMLRRGILNPLTGAPFGYQYIKKAEGASARYEIVLHEAKVVRTIFEAVVRQQKSQRQVAKLLNEQGAPTRGQSKVWTVGAIHDVLANPAYMGKAAYGKKESVERVSPLRLVRGRAAVPRQVKSSRRRRPSDQWIYVDVPPLVSAELFEAAREQLERNRTLSQRNAKHGRYLLQGLVVCTRCGYAYYGQTNHRRENRGYVAYSYYRCIGADARRFADGAVCANRPVRLAQLEQYVWRSACELLENPERLMKEWTRRGDSAESNSDLERQRSEAARVVKAQQLALRRLIDAYEAGILELAELKKRTERVQARLVDAERAMTQLEKDRTQAVELKAIVSHLDAFAERVRDGLSQLSWGERRQLVRTLIACIQIDEAGVTVVYRVPATSVSPVSSLSLIHI